MGVGLFRGDETVLALVGGRLNGSANTLKTTELCT